MKRKAPIDKKYWLRTVRVVIITMWGMSLEFLVLRPLESNQCQNRRSNQLGHTKWAGSIAGCWRWMFFLQKEFNKAIPTRLTNGKPMNDADHLRSPTHLALPFDCTSRSIRWEANCSSEVFRSISNISVIDSSGKYVRTSHVERIHLRFR